MAEASKIKLAGDLETSGVSRAVRRSIVRKLRDGYYDEYNDDSQLATPLVTLVIDLRRNGLAPFAVSVINGEYDADLADSTHWIERQTGEVSDLIDALGIRNKAT